MYLLSLSQAVDARAFELLRKHSNKVSRVDNGLPWNHELTSRNKRIVGKVSRVEMGGVVPTFDIEVADNHWYYAGAVKSHNTLSKAIFDTTEGAHTPLGKYIFNNVVFSKHDPLVKRLKSAGYRLQQHPFDPEQSVLVTLPVSYPDVPNFTTVNGQEISRESAVAQLERYKMLQMNYVDHNTSITVSYDPSELKDMVKWYMENWDSYVATSFLFRADPTKTAKDLGFAYLPQEVVTKESYDEYVDSLKHVDIDDLGSLDTGLEDECAGGACPIR
jgi:ribonucleoside-triphosphate reductase (formate)